MSATKLAWFKSSYSGTDGDNCVEVAMTSPVTVRVRDSKDTMLPHLNVSCGAWASFLAHQNC